MPTSTPTRSTVTPLNEMVWPPRSGKTAAFPEIDGAAWFDPATALQKINPAQASLIDELMTRI